MTDTNQQAPTQKQPLGFLSLLHILNDGYLASFVILLPFIAAGLGLSLTQVGMLGSILNTAAVALALPAGYLAARFGGLRILLGALMLYGGALFALGASMNFLVVGLVFLVAGVGFGVFHPIAFALIARWSPKETRGRAVGNFTAIGDLGRIGITAAVSFIAVKIGWRHTAILYSIALVVVATLCVRYIRKTHPTRLHAKHETDTKHLSLVAVLHNARFILVIIAAFFDSIASKPLFIFLPFLLIAQGINPVFLGSFGAIFFVGNFGGKLFLGRLVDVFGNTRMFLLAELSMAVLIVLLANSSHVAAILICSLLLGVFTKGTTPIIQTMVAESVEHHGQYEKAYGIAGLTGAVGDVIGPLIIGILSDRFGIAPAFYAMAVAALLAVVPTVFYGRLRKHHSEPLTN